MTKRINRIKWDNKAFVKAYLNSTYNWEVAEQFGVSQLQVNCHASYLRRNGVKLPSRYQPIEADELNNLIQTLEAELGSAPKDIK
jgi:hypothetical protein